MARKIKDVINGWFSKRPSKSSTQDDGKGTISPGRVSKPDDDSPSNIIRTLQGTTGVVTPSFRTELIPLIRDLYKVNPDVSIALQDMFKLSNTGHTINFSKNTENESAKMREHLREASKKWSTYTGGIDGLVNKFIVQLLVGGAISIECVPNKDLTGIETILFIKPETIRFKRENNGVYQPYQKNPHVLGGIKDEYIKLNTETYCYVAMYNDTDEPYGIPPFMPSLDSLAGQHVMRKNFKHIMEIMGMVGFLEAKMAKPPRNSDESARAYRLRLESTLNNMKKNILNGMSDGVVVGYMEDHEFKLNSTSASMQNINLPWNMNQQSVANGLGVNGSIIGVSQNNTEGGSGVQLSKMISQLKNIQMLVIYVLEFIYSLELRLAGFNNKGISIDFATSTVSDDIKLQQAREYRARVNVTLYNQGIISQEDFARDMGYEYPDQKEPRQTVEDENAGGTGDAGTGQKKKKREDDKDKSDRKTRDKNNPNPKRADQDSKPR